SRIGRPFLEFTGLAYQAAAGIYQSFTRAAERGRKAVELARRHGWAEEQAAGLAYVILGAMLAWQLRPGEAEAWVQRAERVLRAETEPAAVLGCTVPAECSSWRAAVTPTRWPHSRPPSGSAHA